MWELRETASELKNNISFPTDAQNCFTRQAANVNLELVSLVNKIPAAARTLYAAHPAAVRDRPRVAKTTRGRCYELHNALRRPPRSRA